MIFLEVEKSDGAVVVWLKADGSRPAIRQIYSIRIGESGTETGALMSARREINDALTKLNKKIDEVLK